MPAAASPLANVLLGYGRAPPAETPVLDVSDQLRKLAELRDAGVLSPAEFDAKKTDLMKRI